MGVPGKHVNELCNDRRNVAAAPRSENGKRGGQ